jgi:hypothetical protein
MCCLRPRASYGSGAPLMVVNKSTVPLGSEDYVKTLGPPPLPENLQPPQNVTNCTLFMVCQPAKPVIQELIVSHVTETSYP